MGRPVDVGLDLARVLEGEDSPEFFAEDSDLTPQRPMLTPLTVRLWFISCNGVSSGMTALGIGHVRGGAAARWPGWRSRTRPACRTGARVQPLPPVIAAQRVQNHVNTFAGGERADLGRVIDGPVIDGVRAALGSQHLVLAGQAP